DRGDGAPRGARGIRGEHLRGGHDVRDRHDTDPPRLGAFRLEPARAACARLVEGLAARLSVRWSNYVSDAAPPRGGAASARQTPTTCRSSISTRAPRSARLTAETTAFND